MGDQSTAFSGAGQGGGSGSIRTASGRAARLAGLAASASLWLQYPSPPHGGALGCHTRSPLLGRPASWVGGWLQSSSSESARSGSSMNKGKGKCLPQGGA